MLSLEQILFSQGFGTRRECRGLVLRGSFSVSGKILSDPEQELQEQGLVFSVDGQSWPYFEKAVIALNKPAGYECSARPVFHPGVLSLLPAPLRARGVQPVGRLDEDTTGLLILTDDGALSHRLTHPRKHVRKIYRAVLKHPLSPDFVQALLRGVVLRDEPQPLAALEVKPAGDREVEITVDQGRYHQVKRMVAAAGNRVEQLSRIQFGNYRLPQDVLPGQWCWIESAAAITGK